MVSLSAKQNRWAATARAKFIVGFYNSRCAICGVQADPECLQMAHIRDTGLNGRGRGRKERISDIRRNPDCYRPMHRDCHKYYDSYLSEEEPEMEEYYPET